MFEVRFKVILPSFSSAMAALLLPKFTMLLRLSDGWQTLLLSNTN